jgi:hypothetical protein
MALNQITTTHAPAAATKPFIILPLSGLAGASYARIYNIIALSTVIPATATVMTAEISLTDGNTAVAIMAVPATAGAGGGFSFDFANGLPLSAVAKGTSYGSIAVNFLAATGGAVAMTAGSFAQLTVVYNINSGNTP